MGSALAWHNGEPQHPAGGRVEADRQRCACAFHRSELLGQDLPPHVNRARERLGPITAFWEPQDGHAMIPLRRRGDFNGERGLINVVDFELLNQLTDPQGSEKERRKGSES